VHVPVKGYGSALLSGFQAARGKYVLMADSDMSYDFIEASRFLARLREGYDLVMGCRMPKGGGMIFPGAMPWLHRWFGNPVLSALARSLFNTRIIDIQCGIRAFHREKLMALDFSTYGMEFASEMVIKAALAKFKMDQVPVTLRPDGRQRPPHLQSWRDGWRNLRFMLIHAPTYLFLYPGLTLTMASLLALSLILCGTVHLGGFLSNVTALLFSTLGALLGFEILLWSRLSTSLVQVNALTPTRWRPAKRRRPTAFESGLCMGIPLCLAGFIVLIAGLNKDVEVEPAYIEGLQTIILAILAIGVGIQCVFGGFALATVQLRFGRKLPCHGDSASR
jgi:hypothetical protein